MRKEKEKEFVYVWIAEFRDVEGSEYSVDVLGVFKDLKTAQESLAEEVEIAKQEEWEVYEQSKDATIMICEGCTHTYTIIRKELE